MNAGIQTFLNGGFRRVEVDFEVMIGMRVFTRYKVGAVP
jgi:hypothetical protein